MDAVSSRVLLGAAGSTGGAWGAVNMPFESAFCVWTGDRFLSGGVGGVVATSTDGTFWSTEYVTNTLTGSLSGIINGGNNNDSTAVLVDSAGRIFTSPLIADKDFFWTQRTSGVATSLTDVVWGSTQFIAVGASGRILSSPDGVTWTAQTSGVAVSLNGVKWDGAQFIAIGASGTIITSPDGVAWTAQTSGTANDLLGLASSGSLLVAVGERNTILSSPDGVTWTTRTSGLASTPQIQAIVWTGSVFVAGVYTVTSQTDSVYSADGITWTRVQVPCEKLKGLAWSGTVLAFTGELIKTNTTWTTAASMVTRSLFKIIRNIGTITSTPSGFYVVAGTSVFSTTDAINWTGRSTVPGNQVTQIIWNGSLFVTVAFYGNIYTSPDAITWTERAPDTGQFLYGVAWSGSIFAAVGGDTAGHIRTSPDGTTWTTRTSNSTSQLKAVAWGNSIFVAVGANGKIVTSPTGTTWTARTSGLSTDYTIECVTYGNGKFVALAYIVSASSARAVLTSTNGTTWTVTDVTATVTQPMNDVAAVTGGFVAAGRRNTICTSPDGLSWTQAPYTGGGISFGGSVQDLQGVATNGARTIAVGNLSQIYALPRPATPPYPSA